MKYINTRDNLADFCTKALTPREFLHFRQLTSANVRVAGTLPDQVAATLPPTCTYSHGQMWLGSSPGTRTFADAYATN